MSPGITHLTVVLCGMLGLVVGGMIIDLDHRGTWSCKWHKFWDVNYPCYLRSGIFHDKTIMLSMILFSFCFSISLALHYLMDFVVR